MRAKDARAMGGGVFLTEFGAITDEDMSGVEEVEIVMGHADSMLASTAYWQFKSFHDVTTQAGVGGLGEGLFDENGVLLEHKATAIARTYAPRISGTPTLMSFDPRTAQFRLECVSLILSLSLSLFLAILRSRFSFLYDVRLFLVVVLCDVVGKSLLCALIAPVVLH
jgi:hypothetical protein